MVCCAIAPAKMSAHLSCVFGSDDNARQTHPEVHQVVVVLFE